MMFTFAITVVLLTTGSFSPLQALDYLDFQQDETGLGGKDLDEEYQLAWKCTWFVFCDLHHIMEAKTLVDGLDNRTVLYLANEIRAMFPDIEVTDEEIFDTEAWERRAEQIACSFTDEDREKLRQIPLTDYASEVCEETREDREECNKLAATADKSKEIITNHKEECAEDEMGEATAMK
ncbi:uncharacterized protein LOC129961969 [Argiope bruennichi]|uniref:uncharacterized protein LOC129961969 n=1 Tax=Argiope bruennichi TaxID=94029 RepID=UPI0024948ABF|nr:uncharacterized protein LOC129961969 [Argiope bruennichi]